MRGQDLKQQRDSYLAFALAAADVLISSDVQNKITQVVGATNALLGGCAGDLAGRDVLSLFEGAEAIYIGHLIKNARAAGRIDPCIVSLTPRNGEAVFVNLGIMSLPATDNIHMTFTVLPPHIVKDIPKRDLATGLLDRGAFQQIAAGMASPFDAGSGSQMLSELRMIRLEGLPSNLERLPSAKSKLVMAEIGAYMRAQSTEGGIATQLDDDKFGIIASAMTSAPELSSVGSHVGDLLRAAGIANPKINATSDSIKLDLTNINSTEAAKALAYAISIFGKGERCGLTSLSACLDLVVERTVSQFSKIKLAIALNQFSLNYQPIVDIRSRSIHHHEALVRLQDGSDPFGTIAFSEQVGLIQDLDMAISSRVLGELREHPAETVAVNLSGRSLESEAFRNRLFDEIKAENAYAHLLMIELTESAMVEDIEPVAKFIQKLRDKGIRVCLDDFGAGATAYNYLCNFGVDFVKVDGPFLKRATKDRRQRAIVQSIVVLCRDLGTSLIAEMIESKDDEQFAIDLGIEYGQGYLYGRPINQLPSGLKGEQRLGKVESWQ
ncbi:EAL domain-containing protein [Asticcacaulis sp. SL142]|uniref:EAL domain-containing protein n=1 Tax=Asticcacaulis sp. SL142 TaxID=2995155 RepID=UPI00226CDA0F|nr:EAL domain-containing protein [Asticcacaulis sp. SL142]WAC48955.1 EAL domain-containing protein [Asticcacaulis sp. SL142]